MKYLFITILIVLSFFSLLTWWLEPDMHSDKPIIYWVTDPNPARLEQVRMFHKWLEKNDYPPCELRLDTANSDVTKRLIQGVSGIAGDAMDIISGANMRFFQAVGMLEDITDDAKKFHFDPSETYAAMESEIVMDGVQYMFPCNVPALLYWVNKDTLAKYGIEVPPRRMDIETFERLGKEFVAAANQPGQRRTVFFCYQLRSFSLRRSMGASMYNETLTRCTLDDERNIDTWKLLRKWTYEDHIMPTPSESESFSAAAGYEGSQLQLFNNGNYAMIAMGRYALIQLREFGDLNLTVCEPPNAGFPNCYTITRAAAMYKNSKHPESVKYFLAYLASEDYNMQIVRDADALPPNPKYTKIEAFKRPLPLIPAKLDRMFEYTDDEIGLIDDFKEQFYAVTDTLDRDEMLEYQRNDKLDDFVARLPMPPKSALMDDDTYEQKLDEFQKTYCRLIKQYQNEWGCHEVFSESEETIAIGQAYSPFIVPLTGVRIEDEEYRAYMAGVYSAEKAARLATKRINGEIQRTLLENPELQQKYDELCKVQKEIDRKRAAGEIIPLKDIENPFHRRYYVHKGWAK